MTADPSRTEGARPRAAVHDDEISIWEVLAVLIRRRRLILASIGISVALAVVWTFLQPRTWSTSASFQPQGAEGPGELASLAAQFGVSVGGGETVEGPAFYQELLTSREILARVAGGAYEFDGATTPLVDIIATEVDSDEPRADALRVVRAIEWLRNSALTVSTGRETSILTLTVETEWPEVSVGIARALLDEVARFNLETRQSRARAERDFIEARVAAAEASLRDAESELQQFLGNNRVIGEFSQTKLEFDRLQREVLNRQQVYTTLIQSFEQARISEVRDTPVITVLQQPYVPVEPDRRGLVLALLTGLLLGAVAGGIMAFFIQIFGRPADDPAERDFKDAWADLVDSVPMIRARRTGS